MSSERRAYPAGYLLFREGDPGADFYMLTSGAVEVSISGQAIANISESGALLGEVSFLLSSPRTATVRTLAASEFLVVHDLEQLIESNPALMARIARTLAQRLQESDVRFVKLRRSILAALATADPRGR